MALINCPDCGKQVSSEAPACPSCGRPLAAARPAGEASFGGAGAGSGGTGATGPGSPAQPVFVRTAKSRGTFIVLGIFLGGFGVHNFYAGYTGKGAAQLIITLALGWLIIGFLITGIWALVEVCTVKVDAKGYPLT